MTTTEINQKGDTSISQEECKTSEQASTTVNANIEMNPRIGKTRNEHGVKVKRWCASCLHMEYDVYGNRTCKLWNAKVMGCNRCKKWQMSDGLKNAGISGGVVRRLEFKEVIID